MKSHLNNPEPRTCPVCGDTFIPLRNVQMFCSPPKRCRYTNQARILKRAHAAAAAPQNHQAAARPVRDWWSQELRECTKCGQEYTPTRPDQKTCGANCPGKPDYTMTCASPSCGKVFTVKGNSQGKGNQRFCSEQCRDRESEWRMRQRFRRYNGMSVEEFQRRVEVQDGKCMICRQPPRPDSRSRREGVLALEVDHDHATGATRDLLCGDCNKGLGMFHDNPAIMHAAILYVERHQASESAPQPEG